MSSILIKKLVEHAISEVVIDSFTRDDIAAASLDLTQEFPNSYQGEQEGYLHILLVGIGNPSTLFDSPEFTKFFDPATKLQVLHKGCIGTFMSIPVYSDIFDEPKHRWLLAGTARLVAVRMSEVDNYLLYKELVESFSS